MTLDEVITDHEILVIDDGSTDQTWASLTALTEEDTRIKAVRFTRNFGKEAAIYAGLNYSRGQCTVIMDADLQHPPELIPSMYRLWKEDGYDVVHCEKKIRQDEPVLTRFFVNLFYTLMRFLSGYNLKGATDYKLLDRAVVQHYLDLPEHVRFFRGLVPWLGFRNTVVSFSPSKRAGGHSRWSYPALARLGIRAICSFSSMPMQVVTLMGGIMFAFTILLGAQTLFMKISGKAVEGFTTVILLLLLIGSILMVSLGVIGQYIAMIYEEVKRRPSYIVDETKNCRSDDSVL
jgi:glycosyltransferase involved in cell wall biosynthesis